MNRSRTTAPRLLLVSHAVVVFVVASCATTAPHTVHVLQAPPTVAYRTLGMVSGQGPNIAAAVEHARYQAAEMGADAVVVTHQHNVGTQWIVSVKAIRYMAPPAAPPPQY